MDNNLPVDDATAKAQKQQRTPNLAADQAVTASQQPTTKKQDYQVQQPSGLKEQKEALGPPLAEGVKIVEKKEFEPSEEVAEWMEKVEGKEIELPQPVKDEYGQILVRAARITKPKIVMPISKKKMKKGLHYKVADSIRWLAEWCLRLIKMFPERIVYKKVSAKKAAT